MSISAADKIFLDIDDEINFVVEKIKAAERDRVIVVVPQNALVVSSLVSLKILEKQIARSKKNIILVTEDEFGRQIADKAGLKSVDKVSSITAEMWEAAQILKTQSLDKTDKVKKRLLQDRGAIEVEPEYEVDIEPGEIEADEPVEELEIEEPETEQTEMEPEPEHSEQESEAEPEKPEEKVEEVIEGPIKRRQLDPKLVKVGSFEILAGGDISEPAQAPKSAIIEGSKSESDIMDDEPSSKPGTSKKKDFKTPLGGFTGRDWTSYTGRDESGGIKKYFKLPSRKQPAPGERAASGGGKGGSNRKRLLIIAIISILVLFLGAGYVLAYRLSSAEVRLKLQTAEVPVEQQITGSTVVDEVDAENLTIPAQLIAEDDLSISASNQATGKGNKGDKAAGLIDLWNKTDEDISLKKGTVLQNTTTNLKYVLTQSVTVPAAEFGSEGEGFLDVGQVQDVSVEAEKFGEDYNITEAGTKVDFKVADHDTEDLIGKRFRDIEGGTTEEFVAVSEDDVKDVGDTLKKRLEEQGKTAIKDAVPTGFILIDGSEKMVNVKVTSSPDVGEEAEEFSVSVTARMTAFMVSEADLQAAIQALVENNEEMEGEFEVDTLEDIVIADVERNEDSTEVTFTVNSSGSIKSKLTEDDVKGLIAGKTLEESNSILNGTEEIVEFRLEFQPAFVPDLVKQVPNDYTRIKVVFE